MLEVFAWDPPGWGGALVRGALVTLEIAIFAYLIGIGLGLLGAVAKLSGNRTAFWVAEAYTLLVRAVPELLLIVLLYYGGTTLLNQFYQWAEIRADPAFSGVVSAIVVLGIVQGAYQTEVLRGAIEAIPRGLLEAADAYGMSPRQRFFRITIPSMAPLALPGLANLWLIATKDTALISVVGATELLLTAKQAAGATKDVLGYQGAYFIMIMVAAFFYLTITVVSNVGFRALERHYRRGRAEIGGRAMA